MTTLGPQDEPDDSNSGAFARTTRATLKRETYLPGKSPTGYSKGDAKTTTILSNKWEKKER